MKTKDYSGETESGKLERTYPFMSLRLPRRLWSSEYFQNAKQNRQHLISHIDTYKTLKHFFYINKFKRMLTDPNDRQVKKCRDEHMAKSVQKIRSRRGVSLFEKIPLNRNCKEAMVPFEYCNCKNQIDLTRNQTQFVSSENMNFTRAGELLVKRLNSLADEIRDMCIPFKLASVDRVYLFRVGPNSRVYQFSFKTSPGRALFESHFRIVSANSLELVGKIIRIDSYEEQSGCLTMSKFMGYCYCKKNMKRKLSDYNNLCGLLFIRSPLHGYRYLEHTS